MCARRYVDTPLLARQLVDANGGYTLADMAASYPLGRIGRAEEIAHVICSVASPANSFMTGSIIPGHGGMLDRFDSVVITAPLVYIVSLFTIIIL